MVSSRRTFTSKIKPMLGAHICLRIDPYASPEDFSGFALSALVQADRLRLHAARLFFGHAIDKG